MTSLRMRVFRLAGAASLAAGMAAGLAGPAGAAVTCPTVGTGGVVSPAPGPGVDWAGCDLYRADLASADLTGANLSQADLLQANLSGASLHDATLSGAYLYEKSNLSGADLSGANLTHVDAWTTNFAGANLSNADISDSNLLDAVLTGTDMANTSLAGNTTLTGIHSGGITGIPASFPGPNAGQWHLINGYIVGPHVYLNGASLVGADLPGADLERTDLTGADLTDANLTGASLISVLMSGADLSGTQLKDATLEGVSSGAITGTPASLPANWQLTHGYLVGFDAWLGDANLAGAQLAGADLMDSDLSGANLTAADLAGANLASVDLFGAMLADTNLAGAAMTYVMSGKITGTPAQLPRHWRLQGGYLLGPRADLFRSYFTGFGLAGVDLEYAYAEGDSFIGANLNDADLSGADLAGAYFTNASLAGADVFGAAIAGSTWSGATCPDGSNASAHAGGCASAIAFRFTGFGSPRPGSTLPGLTRHIRVHFRLAMVTGAAIPAATGALLGGAREVRVTLSGPGIKATSAYCSWTAAAKEFTCTITVPRGIKVGKTYAYLITAAEKPGTAFQIAPRLGKTANPETVHFG